MGEGGGRMCRGRMGGGNQCRGFVHVADVSYTCLKFFGSRTCPFSHGVFLHHLRVRNITHINYSIGKIIKFTPEICTHNQPRSKKNSKRQ